MPDILSVADHADMIVNGYAFFKKAMILSVVLNFE